MLLEKIMKKHHELYDSEEKALVVMLAEEEEEKERERREKNQRKQLAQGWISFHIFLVVHYSPLLFLIHYITFVCISCSIRI
jgi:hypothetical protein